MSSRLFETEEAFGPDKPNYHSSERKEQEKNEGGEQTKEKGEKSNACTLSFNIGYSGERKSWCMVEIYSGTSTFS